MAMYESEHTQFMREWMRLHPEELRQQQVGRALWWDKPQDLETQRRYAESQVAPKPYVYDTEHK
jgi:hypothetical protein